MKLKFNTILYLPALIGLMGLFLLSVFYYNPNPGFALAQNIGKQNTSIIYFSDRCLNLEFQIKNTEINIKQIENEIEKLKNNVEKDFLFALLKIRAGDYQTAYELLKNHLNEEFSYLVFYDELVTCAKITNNLEQLQKFVEEKKESTISLQYLSADIDFAKGNYQVSIDIYKRILNEDSLNVDILYKLAYSYRLVGNYEQSLLLLTNAEALFQPGNRGLAKILNGKGSVYFLSGDYETAEKIYTLAYNSATESGNNVEKIKAIGNLAIIKDSYGDVYSAREDLSNAIAQAEKINNHYLLAFLYSELGVSFTYTNEILDARNNYEQSYNLYTTLKDHERLSYLSANIGSIFLQETNYISALKFYKEGLKHSTENKLGMILNLIGIADVYSNSSDYSKAIEYYNRANKLADSIQSVASLIKIEQGLGALFYNINKPLRALNFLMQAKERIEIDEYPFESTELFYKIGTVLASVDSIDSSIKYFKDGLQIASLTGDLYNEIILNTELAHNYYLQNNFNEAISHLDNASRRAKEYELTQLMGLQELYYGKIRFAQNKFSDAYNHFIESFSISESASDKNTQIEAGFNLAQLSQVWNDFSEAEIWFKNSVAIIENISLPLLQNQEIQIAHFTGFDEIYHSFINFYLKENKSKEAFELLERSRSRNTMQNLVNLKLTSSIEDENLIKRFNDLYWMHNSDLYSKKEKISIKAELDIIAENFVKKDPSLQQYLSLPWKNIEEIKNNLSVDENLVSVFTSKEKTTIFHLTSKEFNVCEIDLGKADVQNLLQAIAPIYKSDLTSDEIYINQDLFSFDAKAAYVFYSKILKKIIEKIPNEETIIFCFSDELLFLPAELLVTDWEDGDSPFYYKDKKFLINNHPVIYTPSASIYIIQGQKETSSNKTNLLVGNPQIDSDEFTISYRSGLLSDDDYSSRNFELYPLEYSDEEIENVDNTIADNLVLVSEDATEENFKLNASASNLIHLSTHSFLFKNQPLIILSQNNDSDDDGFLEVSDIVELNLNSDLVVISSCRSGLGKVEDAEGIIGMQKAFFEAGANSVVVSLWDVNDKYTSYFMKDFYQHLSQGLKKPDALRNAKLDFITKYSANPYYWSAFILSGNPSKMSLQTASQSNPLFIIVLLLVFSYLIFFVIKFKRK